MRLPFSLHADLKVLKARDETMLAVEPAVVVGRA
jgi:hypothetical protein